MLKGLIFDVQQKTGDEGVWHLISISLKSLEKTELKSASTLITCHDIKKDLATTYDVTAHKKLPLTRSVVVQGSGFPVDKRYLCPREEEAVGGGTTVCAYVHRAAHPGCSLQPAKANGCF